MPAKLDLAQSYTEKLTQRGIPASQRRNYLDVLADLVDYLEVPPEQWEPANLETFLTARARTLTPEKRGLYGAAMGILTELLETARARGYEYHFGGPTGGVSTRSDGAGRAESGDGTDASSAATERVDGTGPDVDDPLSLLDLDDGRYSVEQDVEEDVEDDGEDDDAQDDLFGDSDFGLLGSDDESDAAASQSVAADDDNDLAGDDLFGPALGTEEPLELLQLDDEPTDDAGDSGPDLGLAEVGDQEGVAPAAGSPTSTSSAPEDDAADADVGLSADDLDAIALEEELPDDADGPSLRSGRVRSATRASGRIGLPGWETRKYLSIEFGDILLDDRYTIERENLLESSEFEVRKGDVPSALEEFARTHRSPLLIVAFGLCVTVLGFLVSGLLGLALLAATLAGGGAIAVGAAHARRVGAEPPDADTPERAVREYVAALRLGLFHRARSLMAYPLDVELLGIRELMEVDDDAQLGKRFNTLAPGAMRVYWASRIGQFDEPGESLIQRLIERYTRPEVVEIERVMSSEDDTAAVVIVRAGAHDEYAVVPTLKLGEKWYVGAGQLPMRAAKLELLGRLGRRHAAGNIDDTGFVKACQRHNLTRADITRGRIEGVLSEGQASMLARRTLMSSSTPSP